MSTTLYGQEIHFEPTSFGFVTHVQSDRHLSFGPKRNSHIRWMSYSAIVVALMLWLTPQKTSAASYTAMSIIEETNTSRMAQHLAPVVLNPQLTVAAQAKAADMFAKQYFQHVSPSGTQPWSFISSAGYTFTLAGENLAADFIDGHDVVSAWLHSAEHRKNLLNGSFHDIGVAVVDGVLQGQQTTIVVQLFGQQRALPIVTTAHSAPKPEVVPTSQPPSVSQPQPEPVHVDPVPQFAQIVEAPLPTTPSVAGVTTEVIPTPEMADGVVEYGNPVLPPLVAVIFAAYITFLTALIGVVSRLKKAKESTQQVPLLVAIS